MMSDYQIDSDEIIEFWLAAFEAMSSDWIETFAEALEFPVKKSKELVRIARDCVIASQNSLGESTPENASYEFTVSASDDGDSLVDIWKQIFSRLEAIGHAATIYEWGQKHYRQQIRFSLKLDFSSDWDVLLIHWARKPQNYPELDLPSDMTGAVRLIILRHFITHQVSCVYS